MTRLWPAGVAIAVACDHRGQPVRLSWRGRAHVVTHVASIWRVDLDWWRERVWRAYYRLSTDTGLLLLIYHDLTGDAWYLERLYD